MSHTDKSSDRGGQRIQPSLEVIRFLKICQHIIR